MDVGHAILTVARRRPDGPPALSWVPALVARGAGAGHLLTGRAAARSGRARPLPVDRLEHARPVALGGELFTPRTLVASALRDVSGAVPPGSPVRVVHPATWSERRVAALVEAAHAAGLVGVQAVAAPVAAAALLAGP
ncbi:MAG TPA: hypothetical protein VKV25_05430, partial [Acidimicrobiales bacterium]|nr:hypothetical protein [Acidimicrobiales bacterium]